MNSCWLKEPSERPIFEELQGLFEELVETATEHYGYMTSERVGDQIDGQVKPDADAL